MKRKTHENVVWGPRDARSRPAPSGWRGRWATRPDCRRGRAARQSRRGARRRLFGHIESLRAEGDHYELRFDPAWFLSGETANRAAAEDGAVAPGEPVPNDNYVVEEGHRVLTFLVQPTAHVTVLVRNGQRRVRRENDQGRRARTTRRRQEAGGALRDAARAASGCGSISIRPAPLTAVPALT